MAPTGWPLVLPILVPLLAATVAFVLRKRPLAQRVVSVLGFVGMLFVGVRLLGIIVESGPQAVAISTWSAPFGIVLVADLMSALLVVVAAFIGLVIALYGSAEVGPGANVTASIPSCSS